jgi:hypothetical protein
MRAGVPWRAHGYAPFVMMDVTELSTSFPMLWAFARRSRSGV